MRNTYNRKIKSKNVYCITEAMLRMAYLKWEKQFRKNPNGFLDPSKISARKVANLNTKTLLGYLYSPEDKSV